MGVHADASSAYHACVMSLLSNFRIRGRVAMAYMNVDSGSPWATPSSELFLHQDTLTFHQALFSSSSACIFLYITDTVYSISSDISTSIFSVISGAGPLYVLCTNLARIVATGRAYSIIINIIIKIILF
eukprot:GHVR01016103.1.p1 GENE.GHVR01016103.1~~GHVR01016103.1.p1  ORF type:complete len:129 (+),score=2.79 GHVR01016103.1:311-697(+)